MKKILIGSLVLIAIGFVNPGNLGSMMFLGIICTAGLGLIPFFIVAWIIGSILAPILQKRGVGGLSA